MDDEALRLRTDGLAWRELEGEVVVLDTQGSEYFGINRSGSALWTAAAAGARPSDLVSLLVERYGLREDAASAHVGEFLGDLRRRGFLEPTG